MNDSVASVPRDQQTGPQPYEPRPGDGMSSATGIPHDKIVQLVALSDELLKLDRSAAWAGGLVSLAGLLLVLGTIITQMVLSPLTTIGYVSTLATSAILALVYPVNLGVRTTKAQAPAQEFTSAAAALRRAMTKEESDRNQFDQK
jgi:hypothetical protein